VRRMALNELLLSPLKFPLSRMTFAGDEDGFRGQGFEIDGCRSFPGWRHLFSAVVLQDEIQPSSAGCNRCVSSSDEVQRRPSKIDKRDGRANAADRSQWGLPVCHAHDYRRNSS